MLAGLLQNHENLEQLNQEACKMTAAGILKEMDSASRLGLTEDKFFENSKKFLELARKGLEARKLGEEKYLIPAEEILSRRKNPAQVLLEQHC